MEDLGEALAPLDPLEPAMTFEDIALRLKIPKATVQLIYNVALRKLRKNRTMRALARDL